MPAGIIDISVLEEWSFAETLRHLVFVTDGWLGAILGEDRPFHPLGVAFTDLGEFTEKSPADLGIDLNANPSYPEVLDMRADQVAKARQFLDDVTPERLAEEIQGPIWAGDEPLSVIRCSG